MDIKDYYGRVTKCACTNPDLPESCQKGCFCRGYVAECLMCMKSGMIEENVAGASGRMKVTCSACGGKGIFACNKPSDWDILHPETVTGATGDFGDIAPISPDAIEVHASAQTVNPGDSTWKTPPAKTMHMHNTPVGEPIGSIT